MHSPPGSVDLSTKSDSPFSSVPVEILICVGKARPLIRDLIAMKEDDLLSLDTNIDDPVELFVGERLIARGILEENDGDKIGNLIVRILEVTHPREEI